MTITREDIAAFVDGELDPAREAQVAAAIGADPALAEQVEAHRALKQRLGDHFAPILDAPLPDALTAPLRTRGRVIDFAAAREKRSRASVVPRWSWIAAPALAASLALAVFLPRGPGEGYADGALASALEEQLVATQAPGARTRILLSFRDEAGVYCRAFAGEARSGIACRDAGGWRLLLQGGGATAPDSEYRMAGNTTAAMLERAQTMAAGPALDAAEEQAARARGWR